jgi:hypothetical protein
MAHKTREGALKAARNHMGEHSIEGVDFSLKNTGAGWDYVEMPPATGAAAEAQADRTGKVKAIDVAKNEVWVKPDDPLLVGGVLYPNKTRATEAKRLQEANAGSPKAAAPAKPKAKAPVAKKAAAPKKGPTPAKAGEPPKPGPVNVPQGATKSDGILAMLRRPEGATSKQIEDATGWQPHSVRGFLGTLRKNGTEVTSTKEPKQPTIYRIAYVDVV